MDTVDTDLAASIVPDNRRLSIFPQYLGCKYMLAGENLIYRWMHTLWPAYSGGYWTMLEIGNGTFYMRLEVAGPVDMTAENGNARRVSADAAGLVATLYAFNTLACNTEDDAMIEQYHRLFDFARTHPEYEAIRSLID